MPGLFLTLDTKDIGHAIESFDALTLDDFSDLMKEIGAVMVEQTKRHFEGKYGPDGQWAPMSEQSIEGVSGLFEARSPGELLINSGVLVGSIMQEPGPLQVAVGTNVPYAKYQQYGVGPHGPRYTFGPTPARVFLGLNGAEEEELSKLVERYLETKLRG